MWVLYPASHIYHILMSMFGDTILHKHIWAEHKVLLHHKENNLKYKHIYITKTPKVTFIGFFTQLLNTFHPEKKNKVFFSQLFTA